MFTPFNSGVSSISMCIKSLDRQQLHVNDLRYLGTNVMNITCSIPKHVLTRWNVYYVIHVLCKNWLLLYKSLLKRHTCIKNSNKIKQFMIYYNCTYEREKWSIYMLSTLIYTLTSYTYRKISAVNTYIHTKNLKNRCTFIMYLWSSCTCLNLYIILQVCVDTATNECKIIYLKSLADFLYK